MVLTSAEIATNITGITDDQGRFDITGVPPGRVTVTVSKVAHLTTPYGASRPGRPGTPLSLAAGQHLRDISVRLPRGAVITGVIRDGQGDPVANLQVTVQRAALVAGSAGYVLPRETLLTDDRGVYRAFGLAPGEYVVAAVPDRGRSAVERLADAEVDAAFERLRTRSRQCRARPLPSRRRRRRPPTRSTRRSSIRAPRSPRKRRHSASTSAKNGVAWTSSSISCRRSRSADRSRRSTAVR